MLPAHLFIDQSMPLVTEDAEHGGLRHRFFQSDTGEINEALRLRPFPIKARGEELVIRNQIARCHRHFGLREEPGRGGRVEFDEFFEIEVSVNRIDAAVFEINVAATARGIVPEHGRRRAANKCGDFLERGRPQRSIERGVVDVADQRRE
jgi:hypothetical protein